MVVTAEMVADKPLQLATLDPKLLETSKEDQLLEPALDRSSLAKALSSSSLLHKMRMLRDRE